MAEARSQVRRRLVPRSLKGGEVDHSNAFLSPQAGGSRFGSIFRRSRTYTCCRQGGGVQGTVGHELRISYMEIVYMAPERR